MERTIIRKEISEQISGVEVNFSYEHEQGQSPVQINSNFNHSIEREEGGIHASYNGHYSFERESVSHQLHEGELETSLPVLSGIEEKYQEIINSLENQPA